MFVLCSVNLMDTVGTRNGQISAYKNAADSEDEDMKSIYLNKGIYTVYVVLYYFNFSYTLTSLF